jgi:hypothetical protein
VSSLVSSGGSRLDLLVHSSTETLLAISEHGVSYRSRSRRNARVSTVGDESRSAMRRTCQGDNRRADVSFGFFRRSDHSRCLDSSHDRHAHVHLCKRRNEGESQQRFRVVWGSCSRWTYEDDVVRLAISMTGFEEVDSNLDRFE